MAISGARGSMDNLTMMAGSIGQAKVRGKRLERGWPRPCSSTLLEEESEDSKEVSFLLHSSVESRATEFFMLSVSGRDLLLTQRFVLQSQDTCRED